MENYNCLLIGINRYYFLPRLKQGMAAAQTLVHFLLEEMGCSLSRCLVLTDSSPKVKGKSTYPDHQNILEWVTGSPFHHSRNGLFWFFFSGYGMTYQGEDYLIPIDGNPEDIINTGIRMRVLLDILESLPSQILLILDLKPSPLGGQNLGSNTIELTKKRGINLVLSRQPLALSEEEGDLVPGIFTSAFLEALDCHRRWLTLGNLAQHLSQRLPELSEQYGVQMETPVIMAPNLEGAEIPIFPQLQPFRLKWQNFPPVESLPPPQGISLREGSPTTVATLNPVKESVEKQAPRVIPHSTRTEPIPEPIPDLGNPSPTVLERHPWLWWLLLGSSGLLVFGIILPNLFNQKKQTGISPLVEVSPAPIVTTNPRPSPSDLSVSRQPSISQQLLEKARVELKSHQASDLHKAISIAKQVKPDQPFYLEAQADISRWSQVILDIAQGRAKKGDFEGAIAAAVLIPPDDNSVYFIAQKYLENWRYKNKTKQHKL